MTNILLVEMIHQRDTLRGAEADGREEVMAIQANGIGQKRLYFKRHFDTVARHYDRMNTLLSFGLHLLWKRRAVSMAGIRPGDRVLDLCGGTADMALLAARDLQGRGTVCLCDINMRMMELGRRKVEKKGRADRIAFFASDAELMGVGDEAFDVVAVGFGIRNLADMEKGLREIYRVLKPGGSFVCLEFSLPTAPAFRLLYDLYSFWVMPMAGKLMAGSKRAYTYLPESIRAFPSPAELLDIFRELGFESLSYKRLTNGIAVIYLARRPL